MPPPKYKLKHSILVGILGWTERTTTKPYTNFTRSIEDILTVCLDFELRQYAGSQLYQVNIRRMPAKTPPNCYANVPHLRLALSELHADRYTRAPFMTGFVFAVMRHPTRRSLSSGW